MLGFPNSISNFVSPSLFTIRILTMIIWRACVETTSWESWSSFWWLTGNHDSRSISSRSILCSAPSWIVWKLFGRLGYKCGERCRTGRYGRWIYSDILGSSGWLVHLQCAAYEVPLTSGDQKWFGESMVDTCEKNLTKDRDGWRVSLNMFTFFWPSSLKQVSYTPKVFTLPRCTCVHS